MHSIPQENILFVDDEPHLLEGIRRQLGGKFHIQTSSSAEEALDRVQNGGPFALIVSDMQMPGINGMDFLSRLRYSSPESVRIMLTGNVDMQTAIDAVNEGHLFRFLTKPCSPDALSQCLEAGLEYYRYRTTETKFSRDTLEECIKTLLNLLALTNPQAFDRSLRISEYVKMISRTMGIRESKILDTAAQLSQIGCIAYQTQLSLNIERHGGTIADETCLHALHSTAGGTLLGQIPALKEISKIITYQDKHFDGSGYPKDWRKGTDIPLGSRILKVAVDFDSLVFSGIPKSHAFSQLEKRDGWYDLAVLGAFYRSYDLSSGILEHHRTNSKIPTQLSPRALDGEKINYLLQAI